MLNWERVPPYFCCCGFSGGKGAQSSGNFGTSTREINSSGFNRLIHF